MCGSLGQRCWFIRSSLPGSSGLQRLMVPTLLLWHCDIIVLSENMCSLQNSKIRGKTKAGEERRADRSTGLVKGFRRITEHQDVSDRVVESSGSCLFRQQHGKCSSRKCLQY